MIIINVLENATSINIGGLKKRSSETELRDKFTVFVDDNTVNPRPCLYSGKSKGVIHK